MAKQKVVLDLSNVCHVLLDKILRTVERQALEELEWLEDTPDSLVQMVEQMDIDGGLCRAEMGGWKRAAKLLMIAARRERDCLLVRGEHLQRVRSRPLTSAESSRYRRVRKLIEAERDAAAAPQQEVLVGCGDES